MRSLTLAAAVLNQTPLDWDGNQRRILDAINDARASGATVLCLPEMAITGYGCEDAFHATFVHETAWEQLLALEPATYGMIVAVGLPVLFGRALYNTVAVLADGHLVGLTAKQHLAGDGIHYEPRWFKPWPAGVRHTLTRGDRRVPIGDLLYDVGGVRLGFEICEDAWVADRPGARLARHGVDVILNPSASHFAFGKIEVRKRFVIEGSRAFGAAYLYANLLGNEAGRAIYDGGALIAAGGQLLATGPRFSFHEQLVTTATVDLDLLRTQQARTASYRPDLAHLDEGVVNIPFTWMACDKSTTALRPTPGGKQQSALDTKEEEFTRAEALALFDYVRKSRSRGFVISLSGGADSAAVTLLCALALRLALAELGAETFAARLGYIGTHPAVSEGAALDAQARAWTGQLVTCVYQATRNSSATTLDAASTVANALGAEFHAIDVEELVAGYTHRVAEAIGRPLDWSTDDLALQNIQARVRAPGVWMIANIRGALLLSTSNRSEAAVGYATMDGDTAGGLSPIAGIDKAFLRHWLRWMETTGPAQVSPVPALAVINVQAPTAELRPAASKQTDEDDLMPYPVLDAAERAAIRDKRSPVEVFAVLRADFPQYTAEQTHAWVQRFFRLWSRNQWKRERYAPSFHLDDENLDPKTWCRFPILSGGFERELEALRAVMSAERCAQ